VEINHEKQSDLRRRENSAKDKRISDEMEKKEVTHKAKEYLYKKERKTCNNNEDIDVL
jgi:hypothetical protein